ncbi:MAG: sigma-54 dependent transcriptional regulator [Proteobacteria bacterium]|nr:sigma-54 dependent transcriptional regulator [Pseudomonadota bacterium]
MARILIVDDDRVLCTMLIEQLQRKGYETDSANTLRQGLSLASEGGWDVILLDVQMPDGNGLEFIPDFIGAPLHPEVIIITGHGAADGAEKAIVGGAWSYIEKPHVIRDLPLHLTRALQFREEKQRFKSIPVALKRQAIIGNSSTLCSCLDQLASAAASDVSILLTGDTGTGKELFAQALHENSDRSSNRFVVVDCASLPDTLIESTLFGHVKGAFTGADRTQEGLIQHAHKGTLFLDEVGELPPAIQKTFLRVLQERKFRPVGGANEINSNFRLVAATNRNLKQMVADGTFRSDLLFRLQAMTIRLPPLRERLEDIRELVTYFLGKLCERYDQQTKGIGPDLIEALMNHDWPGNVRELYQTVEQIFAETIGIPTLFSVHLPQQLRVSLARATIQQGGKNNKLFGCSLPSWKEYKNQTELHYWENLMQLSGHNIQKACQISGLSRARIYQLLDKHDSPSSQLSPPTD